MKTIRLDKYISVACGISRNDARNIIKKGTVCVDGTVIKNIDYKVNNNIVSVNGEKLEYNEFVYLILNKPAGIISASTDKRVKTVVDLVPKKYRHYDLFPVGRLDRDTTGLLLITNDGDFAHRVISPKSNIEKQYKVTLDGEVTEEHIGSFLKGVVLADNTKCLPAKLEKIGECEALVKIMEGKYHQIKRMFGTIGLGVNALRRLSIGDLVLPGDIQEGKCREMTEKELNSIFSK